jgi:hypothetical protein
MQVFIKEGRILIRVKYLGTIFPGCSVAIWDDALGWWYEKNAIFSGVQATNTSLRILRAESLESLWCHGP